MRGGCDQMPFANLFDPMHAGAEEAVAEANAADPPLVMAVLDRIVDGAIVLKLTGKSYRAHRAKQLPALAEPAKPERKS